MINILLSQNLIVEDLKEYIKPYHKVAVVPFTFDSVSVPDRKIFEQHYLLSGGKYREYINPEFNRFGIEDKNIEYLNYYSDTVKQMRSKINNSDLLFLTGGLPDAAVRRIFEKNLVSTIKAYKNTVIGVSAGAFIQMDKYFCTPDEEYPQMTYFMGLGLVENDFYTEVHYNKSDFVQSELLQRTADNLNKPVFALDDSCSIIIDNKEIIMNGDIRIFRPNKVEDNE